MWAGLEGADIVMMLRLQRERMTSALIPSQREYFHFFGLDYDKLARAKPDALVMHPGPMNRGVEIDSNVADDAAQRDPRAGRDGRRGTHGRAPGARPSSAERIGPMDVLELDQPAPTRPVALVNARLVDPGTGLDQQGGVLISEGAIADLGPHIADGELGDVEPIDCGGRILTPGLVDMMVFTGEPGHEHRETLATASRAAAAGGVTTFVVMPNTDPVIDDVALVDFILRRARDTGLVNVAPNGRDDQGPRGRGDERDRLAAAKPAPWRFRTARRASPTPRSCATCSPMPRISTL